MGAQQETGVGEPERLRRRGARRRRPHPARPGAEPTATWPSTWARAARGASAR
nr:hypothetical protein [Angustibacter aerolatus]